MTIKKANVVWDSESQTISLSASQNEMVGCQVILERLGNTLRNIQISVSDLTGPENAKIASDPCVEKFLLHYVQENGKWYPDAAIPVVAPPSLLLCHSG